MMGDSTAGQVLGIGGVFFRSKDPARLAAWYAEHLGLSFEAWGDTHGTHFAPDGMPPHAFTVFSIFKSNTEYFGPSGQSFMLNLIVDDLDAALARVVAGGAERLDDIEEHDYGRFGWFIDPDGNRVELWQPPEKMPEGDG